MVAPAYDVDSYINHDVSANLDLTFAFEGPEKLLELWFFDSPKSIPCSLDQEGLRLIPLKQWVEVLDLVNCKILSMKSSNNVDAYLLSELSLFVFPHKMILKTCGTTTTLACLERLFEILNEGLFKDVGFDFKAVKVFYLRRSFMFPLKQKHVHRDWKHEVARLNHFFGTGKSYIVGDFASDDHWYLYMGGPQDGSHGGRCDGSMKPFADQTLEVLMTELSQEKAKNFVTSRKPGFESLAQDENDKNVDLGHETGMHTMQETKLDSILSDMFEGLDDGNIHLPSPSHSDGETEDASEDVKLEGDRFIHDAFSFTPCGFSSNSITKSGVYYTLHITPESGWSYASFETNYPFHKNGSLSVTDVLLRVLSIFEPGKFSVTLMTEEHAGLESIANIDSLSNCSDLLVSSFKQFGYEKQEKALYDLKGHYQLLYLNYAKFAKGD